MTPDWLTEEQAQEYLQVSRSTLYRWQQQGSLTVYKFGGSKLRRYKRADLDALAEPVTPDEEGEGSGDDTPDED